MGLTYVRSGYWLALLVVIAFVIAACGASFERSAMSELEEDGYTNITVRPLKRADNAFSFDASRDGEPCRGEIEVRDQMGRTTATVTSQCGEAIQ